MIIKAHNSNASATERPLDRFLAQFFIDSQLWLFCFLLLLAGRVVFLATLIGHLETTSSSTEIFTSLLYGLRFDAKVATRWLLPLLLLDLLTILQPWKQAPRRIRLLWGGFFIFTSIVLTSVAIDYYKEYRDVFNEWLFGLVYDDVGAIVTTLVKSYGLIPKTLLILVLTVGLFWVYRRLLDRSYRTVSGFTTCTGRWRAVGCGVLIILLVLLGLRGSWGPRPAQIKDVGIFKDRFLNKVVLNPFITLIAAVDAHAKVGSDVGLTVFQPDGNIRAAVRTHFNTDQNLPTLDDYFKKTAAGPKGVVPRHILLLVMESYDSWPMGANYQDLGLAEGLRMLASKGLWWQSFLPASVGTMPSLAVIISGIADVAVHTNYQVTTTTAYATAAATIFKGLGYRTNLFYGGFLTWENIEQFARNQGFEQVYGASHITSWTQTSEWGVDDESLFAFVADTLRDDTPSFSLIMSVSNHPPYNLDLQKAGFPLKKLPPALVADLDPAQNETERLRQLGHYWYADRALTRLVATVEQKLPRTVFAVTGDHYGRRHPSRTPTLYDVAAVPLVLYGQEVLAGIGPPPTGGGSHLDIVPTLVELAAPAGFVYHRMGRDLLARQTGTQSPALGVAFPRIIGSNFIFDVPSRQLAAVPGHSIVTPYDQDSLTRIYNQQSAVAWWRIRKGTLLPPVVP